MIITTTLVFRHLIINQKTNSWHGILPISFCASASLLLLLKFHILSDHDAASQVFTLNNAHALHLHTIPLLHHTFLFFLCCFSKFHFLTNCFLCVFLLITDLPTSGEPLRPADKSIISLAAAAAVILASKIHEIRPLRTVSTDTHTRTICHIHFFRENLR